MRWTPEQEALLRIYGNRGPEYCRNLIFKKFGVYRTVEATKRHASRIKASMTRYETCPECGRIKKKLNARTGICEACNYERLWRKSIEKEQRIREQLLKGGETDGEKQARRKYDNQRQKIKRLRASAGTLEFRWICPQKLSPPWVWPPKQTGEQPPDPGGTKKEVCAPA